MLEAADLSCIRSERTLFSGLALRVAPGQLLHVAGENGTGKTSLLRVLCGLLAPAGGAVRWRGAPAGAQRETFHRALRYIGHATGVKDDLTARENLAFAARLNGTDVSPAQVGQALAAFRLGDFADAPARTLSQGQRRRIALARLALPDAAAGELWILDEPFTALDPRGVGVLTGLLAAFLARGGCGVVTTHQDVPLPGAVTRLELGGAAAAPRRDGGPA
jgi:heme exporter protein A